MLYGRAAIPFQTLHFCVGSQQRAHSDAIHFSSLPARFMCGVWVALEDVTLENGPLFYYPGSHKMPEYNFSHIKNDAGRSSYADYLQYEDFIQELINVNEYKQEILIAKKGDALLWSSNILHGGMPVLKDGSSRWSQVTHYFFDVCYYYTPMLSNMVTNELFLRTQVKNIKTNETVASSYNRHTLDFVQTGESNYMFNPNIAAPNIATPKLGVIDMLRFIRRNMRKKS
jgi:ectoine hydroxylase-related dioxygenase (phytanoyl-CoA dioxygenase family)